MIKVINWFGPETSKWLGSMAAVGVVGTIYLITTPIPVIGYAMVGGMVFCFGMAFKSIKEQ